MGGNGRVSSKAAGVGVLRVDVGGAGDVERLGTHSHQQFPSHFEKQKPGKWHAII
jgi:predicted secreted protein